MPSLATAITFITRVSSGQFVHQKCIKMFLGLETWAPKQICKTDYIFHIDFHEGFALAL